VNEGGGFGGRISGGGEGGGGLQVFGATGKKRLLNW